MNRPEPTVSPMSAKYDGTVPFRRIPHEHVDVLCADLGIPVTDCRRIVIEPDSITVTAMLRDDDGKAHVAGDAPSEITARYPLTRWES